MDNEQMIDRIQNLLLGTEERTNARFDQVDARFDQVDARFNAVDARFDTVEVRLGSLETKVDSLGREVRLNNVHLNRDEIEADLAQEEPVALQWEQQLGTKAP